jgi:hypothetical protein
MVDRLGRPGRGHRGPGRGLVKTASLFNSSYPLTAPLLRPWSWPSRPLEGVNYSGISGKTNRLQFRGVLVAFGGDLLEICWVNHPSEGGVFRGDARRRRCAVVPRGSDVSARVVAIGVVFGAIRGAVWRS